ncbi:MAG: 3-dehydroquinate synthase [Pelagibacteraceae bacterium]
MKLKEIKVKNNQSHYSIIIGSKILRLLPTKIRLLCPATKKIALIIDKNVPKKYENQLRKILKKYDLYFYRYHSSEKLKSFKNVNLLVEKCIEKKFNRTDLIISLGGGIVGDFSAFAASILKRGVNFINLPTTLLAQVDSSIGGKTGVNSNFGKNLIGSFYLPKLVISDTDLLKSLKKREMICGYAEILKHSLILKNDFFNWLKINSKKIIKKDLKLLKLAIYKSCKIKLHFVNKDLKEKNLRMMLNFGHTFAHAIEADNKFSRKINHGEAVLIGIMIASRLSVLMKVLSPNSFSNIKDIYTKNELNLNFSKFINKKNVNRILNLMSNDKKNNDLKINLILLKKIGLTTKPGLYKFTISELKKKLIKII